MVVTCIGGFPLYMGPAHEVVEGDWGEMTSNKYFITNKRYILFRVIEIILISIVAALVPSFSDILGFNILCVFDSV
jgi:singapore isolate B (sub-type 7) whole genome shotgun sequence assembly, scaffold_14